MVDDNHHETKRLHAVRAGEGKWGLEEFSAANAPQRPGTDGSAPTNKTRKTHDKDPGRREWAAQLTQEAASSSRAESQTSQPETEKARETHHSNAFSWQCRQREISRLIEKIKFPMNR